MGETSSAVNGQGVLRLAHHAQLRLGAQVALSGVKPLLLAIHHLAQHLAQHY